MGIDDISKLMALFAKDPRKAVVVLIFFAISVAAIAWLADIVRHPSGSSDSTVQYVGLTPAEIVARGGQMNKLIEQGMSEDDRVRRLARDSMADFLSAVDDPGYTRDYILSTTPEDHYYEVMLLSQALGKMDPPVSLTNRDQAIDQLKMLEAHPYADDELLNSLTRAAKNVSIE